MGSWWQVEVGNQAIPVFGKNFVSDQLMLVFADADRFVDAAKLKDFEASERQIDEQSDTAEDDQPPSWHNLLVGYAAEAGALRTRLELQGFSSERVRSLCTAYFDDELADLADDDGSIDWRDSWQQGRDAYPDGASITSALASRRGLAAAADPRYDSAEHPEERFLYSQWESLRDSFDDPRFGLALALTNTPADTVVTLDLTDLVLGGWMTTEEVPHQAARIRMAAAVAVSGPVIVVTEGANDARWLRCALERATPAAAHLFKFLDFSEYRAPGGLDRVVSLTKGMAAAGVMNRIVAVLDNDTAGRFAAEQLSDLALPDRVAVTTLPDVPYGNRYPTLGPGGAAEENINGRAASIEFMFGDDVLRDEDGAFFPVRWQSFIESADEYQGGLASRHKAMVGRRVDRALSAAGTGAMTEQVLEGCRRLADMMLAAADPPPYVPASEFSDLSALGRSNFIGQRD